MIFIGLESWRLSNFFFMVTEMMVARPTPVDREVYVSFGNKCRSNGREVRDVLVEIMQNYIDEK